MIVDGVLDYFFGFLDGVFPVLGFYRLDWLEWASPIVVGIVVILATVIVSVVRRSTLHIEAQQAALAAEPSTESDTSDQMPAG